MAPSESACCTTALAASPQRILRSSRTLLRSNDVEGPRRSFARRDLGSPGKRPSASFLFVVAHGNGFTLVELVAVLALVMILALVVAPRLTGSEFDNVKLADETYAALRYAQRT